MINATSAAAAYTRALPDIAADPQALPEGASRAAAEFSRVMEGVDRAATGAMTGTADTHDLVQAIAQAEIALETVVAIRDRVVEAYQEILRMPV